MNTVWRGRTKENKTGLRIKWSSTDHRDRRESGMETNRRGKAHRAGAFIKPAFFSNISWKDCFAQAHCSQRWLPRAAERRQLSGENAHLDMNQLSTARTENAESEGGKLGSWANSELRENGRPEPHDLHHHPPKKYSPERLHSLGSLSWLGFALSVERKTLGADFSFLLEKQGRKYLIYACFHHWEPK